jgi:hypothetical protein
MRSRGSAARAGTEWGLRLLILVLLAGYLVHTLRVRYRGATEASDSQGLAVALARWSMVAAPARVHVALGHPPSVLERDWLAALPGAGTMVAWGGGSLLPSAIAVDPVADPAGGVDVAVATPAAVMVALRDTLGTLGSVRAVAAGVRFTVPKLRPALEAEVGSVVARGAVHDSLELRRLLVLGAAQWETKFAIAALEERGWQVDAHIAVSPRHRGDVQQGEIGDVDTSRYSAVVAIDTTAARYGDRITRFVRAGGGLLLWSPAAKAPALATLAPGVPGIPIVDEHQVPTDTAPRSALEIVPVVGLRPDAIVLERRGESVTLAARRVGSGRVVETGYTDAWRWRMAGGGAAPDEERTWLARLVASVAYAGRHELAAPPTDVAPVATLIDRLGPGTPKLDAAGVMTLAVVLRWVFPVLVAALLLEWSSRRLRGVK